MFDEIWLQQINREFRTKNIEPQKRPFEALRRLSIEKGISISFNSTEANKIFDWFEKNTKPGIHNVGSIYKSCYFFDACFWVVEIPIVYGQCKLNALDSLIDMPKSIKDTIESNILFRTDYIAFWCDCVDFGFGFDEVVNQYSNNTLGIGFLESAFEELQSTVSMLLEKRINKRSMIASRMSTEMFIKSYLALKNDLTSKDAKRLGHNLEECFNRLLEITGDKKLNKIKPYISIFPEIQSRYEKQQHKPEEIWKAFSFAQTLAAYITRDFSKRDIRPQFFPNHYHR